MSRLMSVAYTEQAILERRKTVTRRAGWWEDKNGRRLVRPGDTVTLCRKVMGRKPGEPLVRLVDVEIAGVRREPLWCVAVEGELTLEGFPELEARPTGVREFVDRYFRPQHIDMDDVVTRIEWRYVDEGGE